MIYLFDSELPENKSVLFSLQHIYGLGFFYSILICRQLGFSKNIKIQDLSKTQINELIKCINFLKIKLTGDLKKLRILGFENLIAIRSYKGLRKIKGFPVRGQRTRTNAKTSRKRFKQN